MEYPCVTLALALGVALPLAAASAQDLAGRIAAVRDGTVRLTFATRADVCGDGGGFIGEETPSGFRMHTMRDGGISVSHSDDVRPSCRAGPLLLVVEKRGGTVTELRAAVGGTWRPSETSVDLGTVAAPEAALWLLDVASDGTEGVARVAFVAASVAEGARIARRLLGMARDRALRPEVRERAVRWVSDVSAREGRGGEADAALRAIAEDGGDVLPVRERAIRELRHTPDNDGYLRDLYRRVGEESLKERILRRLGESPNDQNAAWIRGVALDAREPVPLRERAIRVLGEELDRPEEVRALYGRLEEGALKERALRVAAEQGGDDVGAWLQRIAESPGEPLAARERALRLLGERRETGYLRAVYPRLGERTLQERVLRSLAESPAAADRDWLRGIVLDRRQDLDLRERALRSLGPDVARELVDRLEATALRERVVRMVAEEGGPGAFPWLGRAALDASQDHAVRDRAVRALEEAGAPTEMLVGLYDRVGDADLRVRVVRALAERGDDQAVDKLLAIARGDPDPEMRGYAARRLRETGHPKAREFLEGTVRP
jgi:hypothetical protein